jgi:hypothetical protein
MKKVIYFFGLLYFGLWGFPQQLLHDASVVNVEVSVRVFKDGLFVDNLGIDDFEVYEDGKPQKVEAIYLIKKSAIRRREEVRRFAPETDRYFYLLCEISDYTPKLENAISDFIYDVMAPGDNLTVVTPMKVYRMKRNTLVVLPKDELARQFKEILRKDALIGNAEYRTIIEDISHIVRALSAGASDEEAFKLVDPTSGLAYQDFSQDSLITRYASLLQILESMRRVDEGKLLEFAELLKSQEGQKNVFLLYQRDFIPQMQPDILSKYVGRYGNRPEFAYNISYLFEFFNRDLSFDVERVKHAFSDSSISIHFMFFTKPAPPVPGMRFVEDSEMVFAAFKEMAEATGGMVDSSANPAALFRKAADASENYYILYYRPKDYKADGKFRNIEVKVKRKSFRVIHRAGYFAN